MAVLRLLCIALALYSSLTCCLSVQNTVYVSPNCTNTSLSNCTELDAALKTLNSNTILHLEPGDHILHEYHGWPLHSISNISIVGCDLTPARITCSSESETGLIFINVTNLIISDVIIDGCGLTNASLRNATGIVKDFLYLNFLIPDCIRVGVFLAHCTNLDISNSLVTNTKGLGMLGINIIGNSSLAYVNFTSNIRPRCDKKTKRYPYYLEQDLFKQIGGGAYFLYQDMKNDKPDSSTLVISHCNFKYNADCSYAGYTNVNYQYFTNFPKKSTYIIGGGGGLSVFMPQTTFSVTANVSCSNFFRNDARYGAGAHIGLFAGFSDNIVEFKSCTFESNGLPAQEEGHIDKSCANGGAGVAIFTDLLRNSNMSEHPSSDYKCIAFVDTNFAYNSALVQGGGVLTYSLSKNFHSDNNNTFMTFTKCNFQNNTAKYGSALFVSQRATQAVDGSWALMLSHVTVEGNKASNTPDGSVKGFSSDKISAVDLRSISVLIKEGNLTIQDNMASGIHLMSSEIRMSPQTSLIVQGNSAHRGGGVYMDGNTPAIITEKGCTIIFHANTASAEGGGVYYESDSDQQGTLEPLCCDNCFLKDSLSSSGIFDSNITVYFTDNEAPIGSTVFGSSLNSCSWTRQLNVSDRDLYMELYTNYSSTFKFSQAPQGKAVISTEPHFINVTEQNDHFSSYPGQFLNISISVMDIFANEIDAVLKSDTADMDDHKFSLGHHDFWYQVNNDPVPLLVKGSSEKNITVSLYTAGNLVSTDITVDIMECPIGFNYNSTMEGCACDDVVKFHDAIHCEDEDMVKITVIGHKWLGCGTSNCTAADDLMLLECYFGYCNSSDVVYNQYNSSNQCVEGSHRTGVMCGECEEGYSIVFGDDRCKQCKYGNSGFLFLAMYAVIALLVFLFTALLDVTIDKGWTYMLVFFSNVVFPYTFYHVLPLAFLYYLLIPTRWVSLQAGISHCVIDGLAPLARTGFSLLFPVYLCVLMGLFAILCRCSSFMSEHFSPAKTLVTLSLLLYTPIFKICVEILAAVSVKNLAGTEMSIRWLVDPSVLYFHGWHGFLGAVSIVIILAYIIPFPLLLISPMLAYKYGKRFNPLFDAIWTPFKPNCRMWASVRLLLQIVIVVVTMFITPPDNNGFTINLVLLAAYLYAQTMIQPFEDKLLNVIDSFLVLVVLFVHFIGFFMYRQLFQYPYTFKVSLRDLILLSFYICLAYFVVLSSFLWYSKSSAKRLRIIMLKCLCCCWRNGRDGYFTSEADASAWSVIQKRPTHTSVSVGFNSSLQQFPGNRTFTKSKEDEPIHFATN